MQRFLRASLEVLAFQWKGQPIDQWPTWAQEEAEGGQHGRLWRNGMHLSIDSPKGPVRVNQGDWVVKSEKGLESVEEGEFLTSYQPLDTSGSTKTGEGTGEGVGLQSAEHPEGTDEDTDEDEDDGADVEIEEETEGSGDDDGTETQVQSSSDPV